MPVGLNVGGGQNRKWGPVGAPMGQKSTQWVDAHYFLLSNPTTLLTFIPTKHWPENDLYTN